ncbi:MAG TPA: cytochrome c [Rhizomicrobium sp.]|nr:cytochrome c [Rhizomicrobium sp.]
MVLRVIALAAAVAIASPALARTDSVRQGRLNAIDACSACHQVRPEQAPMPPVHDGNYDMDVSAPSFMEIARNHGTDIAYLRKHITEPEWPMREQMFEEQYLRDIIAYIRSLEPKARRKHGK